MSQTHTSMTPSVSPTKSRSMMSTPHRLRFNYGTTLKCTHTHTHIHTHFSTHTLNQKERQAHIEIHTRTRTHTHLHTHPNTHTHTHTETNTHTQVRILPLRRNSHHTKLVRPIQNQLLREPSPCFTLSAPFVPYPSLRPREVRSASAIRIFEQIRCV
jgi:hypothetical protein